VLRLDVRDDGAGFDTRRNFSGHVGLRSMRERIAATGGTLSIESTVGGGTTVSPVVRTH
jgi:signal transduction histidine kinase